MTCIGQQRQALITCQSNHGAHSPVRNDAPVPVCTRIRRCISHTSGAIFHGRYLHSVNSWNSWNSAGAKNVCVGKVSPRAAEDVSFRAGTLLAVEQSGLEKTPRGCVIYTIAYDRLRTCQSSRVTPSASRLYRAHELLSII